MGKHIQGKDGKFAGSIGEGKAKVPTPSSITPTPLTDTTADAHYDDQFQRLNDLNAARDLPGRLLRAEDGILRDSDVVPATESETAYVDALIAEGPTSTRGLVERFEGGSIACANFIGDGDRHVVAIATPDDTVTAVGTGDQGEADALYAGMAERLGVLGETCEGCGTRIASVYQYCADCT